MFQHHADALFQPPTGADRLNFAIYFMSKALDEGKTSIYLNGREFKGRKAMQAALDAWVKMLAA